MYPTIKDGDMMECNIIGANNKITGKIHVEDTGCIVVYLNGRKDFECGFVDSPQFNKVGLLNVMITHRADGTEVPNKGEVWVSKANSVCECTIKQVSGDIVWYNFEWECIDNFIKYYKRNSLVEKKVKTERTYKVGDVLLIRGENYKIFAAGSKNRILLGNIKNGNSWGSIYTVKDWNKITKKELNNIIKESWELVEEK